MLLLLCSDAFAGVVGVRGALSSRMALQSAESADIFTMLAGEVDLAGMWCGKSGFVRAMSGGRFTVDGAPPVLNVGIEFGGMFGIHNTTSIDSGTETITVYHDTLRPHAFHDNGFGMRLAAAATPTPEAFETSVVYDIAFVMTADVLGGALVWRHAHDNQYLVLEVFGTTFFEQRPEKSSAASQ